MKLCSFEVATPLGRHSRLGAVIGAGIVDLNFACAWHLAAKGEARPYALADVLVPDDMLSFLRGEDTPMGFARATMSHLCDSMSNGNRPAGLNGETLVYQQGDVRLKAPLQNPVSMRDIHSPGPASVAKGMTDPDQALSLPPGVEKLTYEVALAIVVGKAGRRISPAAAASHIGALTALTRFRTPGNPRAYFASIGPVMITSDEADDFSGLELSVTVNGNVQRQGSCPALRGLFEEAIAAISRDEVLYPGEILIYPIPDVDTTGTLERWIGPGDEIVMEVEHIGILRNRVARS